jgi:hypothetical protein
LFFNDNPFAPPPHDLDYIGDINTSKAYIKSYRKYIRNPSKQVLLPVIFYIDGAATGQFADLPVTPLRFTLGIFGQKARDRPHFWRTVGYVPVINGDKSQGVRRFHESGHASKKLIIGYMRPEGNPIILPTLHPCYSMFHPKCHNLMRSALIV